MARINRSEQDAQRGLQVGAQTATYTGPERRRPVGPQRAPVITLILTAISAIASCATLYFVGSAF